MYVFGIILVHIFGIRTEYGEVLRISPYSVRMRENTDQNNSEYRHSSRSVERSETVSFIPKMHFHQYKIQNPFGSGNFQGK